METRKLITAHDVHFVEDEQPMDLTIGGDWEVERLLMDLKESPNDDEDKLESPPESPKQPASSISSESDFEPEGRFVPDDNPPTNVVREPDKATTAPSKWAQLPSREPSTRSRKASN